MAIELDGTYIIECADFTKFVVAATYDRLGPTVHRSMESLIHHMRRRGGTWWSHCGGQYEAIAVADHMMTNGMRYAADYVRARVTRLVGGGIKLRDSYTILPFGKRRIAELADVAVPQLPWSCACGRACGGHCQVAVRARAGDPELEGYCVEFTIALWRAMRRIVSFAGQHGIDLRGTIGGSAWATAKRVLGIVDSEISPQIEAELRRADYGGRAVILRPQSDGPGVQFDISSAYTGALSKCQLPVGEPIEVGSRDATRAYMAGKPGIYTAKVDVPESRLPPLPLRIGRSLVYPHGRFSGTWTAIELLDAQTRGVTIRRIMSGIVFQTQAVVFAGLMDDWYRLRVSVGKTTALGEWVSSVGKSLTGKLSEMSSRSSLRFNPGRKEVKTCNRTGQCREGCTGECGAWTQLDKWGKAWSQPYHRRAPSAYVHWGAYLKSYVREQWLTEAERHDQLVYGNTDSLWSADDLDPVEAGDGIGQWTIKCGWMEFEAKAISCYRYIDTRTGQVIIRAAGGVSTMTDEEWKEGTSSRERGVCTLIEGVSSMDDRPGSSMFRSRDRTWRPPKAGEWYGGRLLGDDGVTYAMNVDRYRRRIRDKSKD